MRERIVRGAFFGSPVVEKKAPKKKEKAYDCSTCGLDKTCLSPRMPVAGKGKRGILIIAEAPGKVEDEVGEPLVGQAGTLLESTLAEVGINMNEDCYKTNVLICRPPNNATPTDMQLKCCKQNWQRLIEEKKPKHIWLMGTSAVDAFFTGRFEGKYISLAKWRRYCIPVHEYGAWVSCFYHPSFALRAGAKSSKIHGIGKKHSFDTDAVVDRDGIIPVIFKKDLRWAVSSLNRKPPVREKLENRVKMLLREEEVIDALQQLDENRLVFDYETNHLKPYRDGTKILTISFKVVGSNRAYTFPFQWKDYWPDAAFKRIRDCWIKVLKNPTIYKIAHNMKFEEVWSRVSLGVGAVNWSADTMLMVHTLDVREKLSGLKVQTFLRYGEVYDNGVRSYIEDTDADGFNNLESCRLEDVLKYNGLDSHFEERIYGDLLPYFADPESDPARMLHLFHEGALAFADMEIEGIGTDVTYFQKLLEKLKCEVEKLQSELLNSSDAAKFKKETGREINIRSTKDLGELFYDVLKEDVTRVTSKTQKPSLDGKALESFSSSFAAKFIRMKRLQKWIKTYLMNLIKETWNGKIHPFYGFNPESGRSNADHPNVHNLPKRDKEGMTLIRTGIIPEKGYEIVSADYKQLEVSIQACCSRDAALIEYCKRTDADMHTDQGMGLFFLDHEQAKELRSITKNAFVFPQIYGDWYDACATYIWEAVKDRKLKSGVRVLDHLKKHGINTLDEYKLHVQKCEREFWELLWETANWRDEQVDFYKRNLYVSTFFGFRRNGFLRRNQIGNTPVQAAAFHCLLWSLIELNKMRKREGWKSKIIAQIHDQIVFMVHPSEKKELMKKVEYIMCEKIKEGRTWIIVPLRIEFESSGVGKPWAFHEEQ